MKSYGMIDGWISKHRPRLHQCPITDPRNLNSKKSGKIPRLSLKNLSGAFTVLGFGLSLAICALGVEFCQNGSRCFMSRSDEKKRTSL